MSIKKILFQTFILCLIAWSCSNPKNESATMLIYGGTIYTVDSLKTVEAVATKDNKIVFAGSLEDAQAFKTNETELVDLHDIIKSKNRSNAGYSVPACGLYLSGVDYPETIFLNR